MLSDRKLRDLYAYPEAGSTWVRCSIVATIDGSSTDGDGLSGSLGGEPDRRVYQMMRTLCDVILVGAGTARTEGYGLVRTSDVDQDLRRKLGLEPVPRIAVVTGSLDVPDALVAPRQLAITTASSSADRRAELSKTMDVVVAGDEQIDWHSVFDGFASKGLTRILCEGGPGLNGALVEADCVDEFCVTIAPELAAGGAKRVAVSPTQVSRSMRLGHAIEEDGVLLTRWVRHHERREP